MSNDNYLFIYDTRHKFLKIFLYIVYQINLYNKEVISWSI